MFDVVGKTNLTEGQFKEFALDVEGWCKTHNHSVRVNGTPIENPTFDKVNNLLVSEARDKTHKPVLHVDTLEKMLALDKRHQEFVDSFELEVKDMTPFQKHVHAWIMAKKLKQDSKPKEQ